MQLTKNRRITARLLQGLVLLVLLSPLADDVLAGGWQCHSMADGLWSCVPKAGSPTRNDTPELAISSVPRQEPATVTESSLALSIPDDLPPPAAGPVTNAAFDVVTPAPTPVSAAAPAPKPIPVPEPGRWAQCPPVTTQRHSYQASSRPGKIDLHAASAESSADNVYTLKGDAVVQHGAQRVTADQIVYRQNAGEIVASGNVQFLAPGLEVNAQTASVQPGQNTGSLQQLSYVLPDLHAHGSARKLSLKGSGQQHLEDVSYTTCPSGNLDWVMTAKHVELDQEEGTGIARDAKVEFKGVPILYVPYMSFPIDDRRKSGLMAPTYGTTEETGADISIPYYWNIAPEFDATITPRYMSNRGLMMGGEFRYLHEKSSGEFRAEYMASDSRFDDQDRSLVSADYRGRPLPRLETSLVASNVSDEEYFEDLGTTIVQSSQSSLERTAAAAYNGDWWQLGVTVQDFQTIDPAVASIDRPYKQLPQINIDAAPDKRLLGLKFSTHAELNSFDHSDGDKLTGKRFDVQPRVSLPIRKAAWYVEPAVSVRHTLYNLDNVAPGENADPKRTTPIASIDAGSFFERNVRWKNTNLVQTLEPRLFYLYVPEKNQDDIPLFDTGNYDYNYWTLFQENRFSGPDRMGDANQVTIALTSRLLDPDNGEQLVSASLGSLVYFKDRKVALPGETVPGGDTSDLISEITMNLGKYWNANAELQWNPHESQTDRNDYRLQYKAGQRQLVNASYRRRRGSQEQTDLSFLWPVGPSWHLVGRWYYSLDDNETIETIAGLGYESCCWGAQLVGRNYINSDNNDRNTAVFFQLELKGLGTLGTSVDEVLERGILGYQSRS